MHMFSILLEYTEISMLLSILLAILLSTLLPILSTILLTIFVTILLINHIKLSNIYMIIQMMFHFVRCPAPSGSDPFDRTSQRSYLHSATCSAHARRRAAALGRHGLPQWQGPPKQGIFLWFRGRFMGFNGIFGYGSIPINTILGEWTSIYQLFWCEQKGYKVLTHCHLWSFSGINEWDMIYPLLIYNRYQQIAAMA